MDIGTITGIGASACTAFSSLPQLITILKKKNAENVSKGMLIVLLAGLALWVSYGVVKKDWIIVISNGLSLIISGCTLAASIIYRRS